MPSDLLYKIAAKEAAAKEIAKQEKKDAKLKAKRNLCDKASSTIELIKEKIDGIESISTFSPELDKICEEIASTCARSTLSVPEIIALNKAKSDEIKKHQVFIPNFSYTRSTSADLLGSDLDKETIRESTQLIDSYQNDKNVRRKISER